MSAETPHAKDSRGTAIMVDGQVVAWFAQFTEEAREWCTENYFGKWLAWQAESPAIVPLTTEEHEAALQEAAQLVKQFKLAPEAD